MAESIFGRLLRVIGLRRGRVYVANQEYNQGEGATNVAPSALRPVLTQNGSNDSQNVALAAPKPALRNTGSGDQDDDKIGEERVIVKGLVRSDAIRRDKSVVKVAQETKEQEKKLTFIAELIKVIPQELLLKTIFRTGTGKSGEEKQQIQAIIDEDFSHQKILDFCGDLSKDESQEKLAKLFNSLIVEMSHKLINPNNQKTLLSADLSVQQRQIKSSAAGNVDASKVVATIVNEVVLDAEKNQRIISENLIGNEPLLKTITEAYLHCASKETVMNLEALGTIFGNSVVDREFVAEAAGAAMTAKGTALAKKITQQPPFLGQLIMAHYARELKLNFEDLTSVRAEKSSTKKESSEQPDIVASTATPRNSFEIEDIVCDQETGKIKSCKVNEKYDQGFIGERLIKDGKLVEIGV